MLWCYEFFLSSLLYSLLNNTYTRYTSDAAPSRSCKVTFWLVWFGLVWVRHSIFSRHRHRHCCRCRRRRSSALSFSYVPEPDDWNSERDLTRPHLAYLSLPGFPDFDHHDSTIGCFSRYAVFIERLVVSPVGYKSHAAARPNTFTSSEDIVTLNGVVIST